MTKTKPTSLIIQIKNDSFYKLHIYSYFIQLNFLLFYIFLYMNDKYETTQDITGY